MNISVLRKELIKSVRGERSQMQVSSTMGYRFNQVYRWETGRTKISWLDFVKYCSVCEIDLTKTCRRLWGGQLHAEDSAQICRVVIAGFGASDAASTSGFSRHKLERWLLGKSIPKLEDILTLLAKIQPLKLMELALSIANGRLDCIPDAEEFFDAEGVAHSLGLAGLAKRNPIYAIADMFFELPEYKSLSKHESGYLSKKLGVSREEEKQILDTLLANGIIEWQGVKYKSNGIQQPVSTLPNNFEDHRRIIGFWMDHAKRVLEGQTSHGFNSDISLMGYRIMGLSDEAYAQLVEEYRAFYLSVSRIMNSDEGEKRHLRILSLQIFNPSLDLGKSQ